MLNIEGIQIKSTQARAISGKLKNIHNEPTYMYPWDNLESKLKEKNRSGFLMVGYGSLINTASAAHTLDNKTLSTYLPVIAFGARRLFNYEMPANIDRYEPPREPDARAALNVIFTGKPEDIVNGVLIEVPLAEIPAMRKREIAYDLVPVVCLKWNEFEKPPFDAYILRCPNRMWKGKYYTSNEITPHHHYYSVCREGAGKIDDNFLRLWLATTFLADGVTPVAKWEVDAFS